MPNIPQAVPGAQAGPAPQNGPVSSLAQQRGNVDRVVQIWQDVLDVGMAQTDDPELLALGREFAAKLQKIRARQAAEEDKLLGSNPALRRASAA